MSVMVFSVLPCLMFSFLISTWCSVFHVCIAFDHSSISPSLPSQASLGWTKLQSPPHQLHCLYPDSLQHILSTYAEVILSDQNGCKVSIIIIYAIYYSEFWSGLLYLLASISLVPFALVCSLRTPDTSFLVLTTRSLAACCLSFPACGALSQFGACALLHTFWALLCNSFVLNNNPFSVGHSGNLSIGCCSYIMYLLMVWLLSGMQISQELVLLILLSQSFEDCIILGRHYCILSQKTICLYYHCTIALLLNKRLVVLIKKTMEDVTILFKMILCKNI